MVWAHSHRVFSTFNYLGVPTEWVADRFRRPDFGLCYELFDHPPECSKDIAHPKRVSREALLLTGLAYATDEKGADWWGVVIRGRPYSIWFIRWWTEKPGSMSVFCEILRSPAIFSVHFSQATLAIFPIRF